MDKTNNLKEYLIDLYNGIASKKPDASRNPQDFRGEIESIQGGGEPWDETDPDNIIIEGEPITDSILIEQTFDENGVYPASDEGADGYSKVTVNVPNVIPDGYIVPTGTLEITENGTHDVTEYANVSVNVASSGGDGEDTLTEFLSWRGGIYLFYNLTSITTIPSFDTSKVTNMYGMFEGCTNLTSVPLFDTSKVTNLNNMFKGCTKLTSVPLFDTRNAVATAYMFNGCSSLTTIPALDLRVCSTNNYMFNGCKALTDIRIRNILASLQVSSGTSYGHLLTVDSLVHLIYESRKRSSSRTLTVGSANLEKLADVYVKAIDITDEMRAEDDLIDEKYPFVVCDSTDEGAMLITTYASTIKNWTIK